MRANKSTEYSCISHWKVKSKLAGQRQSTMTVTSTSTSTSAWAIHSLGPPSRLCSSASAAATQGSLTWNLFVRILLPLLPLVNSTTNTGINNNWFIQPSRRDPEFLEVDSITHLCSIQYKIIRVIEMLHNWCLPLCAYPFLVNVTKSRGCTLVGVAVMLGIDGA